MKTIIISSLLATSLTFANTLSFKSTDGKVSASAKGMPTLISINAQGKGIEGSIEHKDAKLSGVINFDLSSLDSGVELRDEHMKDKYLEVGKFKISTLVLKDVAVENLSSEFAFVGELELHGVKKEVKGTAQIDGDNLSADFTLSLKDYGIEIPSYLGITVSDKVKIKVESKFLK